MNRQPSNFRGAGFSLIELLVSMVIGLIVTLAITSVLIRSEGNKRSTTSVNDVNQTGAYAAFVLDRVIRSAGSGFSQSWPDVFGCKLDVSQGGTHILPFPSAIPTASTFKNATFPIRLAPVIIGKDLATGTGGDLLMVMSGTAGMGEAPRAVTPGSVTTSALRMANTIGYRSGDLVLLADSGVAGGCMVQQTTFPATVPSGAVFAPGNPSPGGSTDQSLPLSGTYFGATGTNVNLTSFGASTIALQLGSATNLPQFQLYGVGANNTLFACDLMQAASCASTTPVDIPIADGVIELRALYGLDTTLPPDGVLDSWTDATGNFAASALTDGSAAAKNRLRQIVAVRVGMILRTSLQERPADYQLPTGSTLKLFTDLPTAVQQTRTLGTADLNYRYRTVEVTIPLRNVLLAPQS